MSGLIHSLRFRVHRGWVGGALALLLSSQAVAHMPVVLKTEHVIERPEISWALYGRFVSGEEVYRLKGSYEKPFALPFEMLVPHRDDHRRFRPRFAVVAAGLPEPTPAERDALPQPLPAGQGALVELNDDPERLVVFESVLRRMYWSSTPIALPIPAGPFEVWIWNADRTSGDFTFALGVEEDFGGGGAAGVFDDWGTYAY